MSSMQLPMGSLSTLNILYLHKYKMGNICMVITCFGVLVCVGLLVAVLLKLDKENFTCSGHDCDEKYEGDEMQEEEYGKPVPWPRPKPHEPYKTPPVVSYPGVYVEEKLNIRNPWGRKEWSGDYSENYDPTLPKGGGAMPGFTGTENWAMGIEQPSVWNENYVVEYSPDMTHMGGRPMPAEAAFVL